MTDISELVQRIKAAAEKATPGKWMWWTSNSFLRLSSDATAKDGGVIDSYRMTDGHTSLRVSKADQDFIALACPENILVLTDSLETALHDKSEQGRISCELFDEITRQRLQLSESDAVLEKAQARIAELEARLSLLTKFMTVKRMHSHQTL